MGKKSNKNKKRAKKKERYIKNQFLEIYCPKCQLCLVQPPNPTFCYGELYKLSPTTFFKECFVELLKLKRVLSETGTSPKDITLEQFYDAICLSICEDVSCVSTSECFTMFKMQIKGKGKRNKKGRKKKNKQKYICQPYPTMFTNDNEEWLNKIEKILIHGNNNRKQNTIEESAEQSKG